MRWAQPRRLPSPTRQERLFGIRGVEAWDFGLVTGCHAGRGYIRPVPRCMRPRRSWAGGGMSCELGETCCFLFSFWFLRALCGRYVCRWAWETGQRFLRWDIMKRAVVHAVSGLRYPKFETWRCKLCVSASCFYTPVRQTGKPRELEACYGGGKVAMV